MSLRAEKLRSLAERARLAKQRSEGEKSSRRRKLQPLVKWVYLIQHEYFKDDVRVRAESLSYLMLFSTLPLLAGCFFVFTLFAQVGMVQDAIQGMVNGFLARIPEIHRGYAEEYVLKFKDAYLASLTEKSGTLGIFSFGILGWIGLKVYNNIELTLNHIWCSERQRPFLERVRNFIVVSVVSPVVIIGGLSLPLILKQLPVTKTAFEFFPVLSLLLNDIVPSTLIFLALAAMYKFLPVERVRWKSAVVGALVAVVALAVTSLLMQIYFKFGTQSAYGKAAILPILGFWIYVVWILIILGAEISYLMQNERVVLSEGQWDPSLREGEGLLLLLSELCERHRSGKGPVSVVDLGEITRLDPAGVKRVVQFCLRQAYIVTCTDFDLEEENYVLARDLSQIPISEVLEKFFGVALPVTASERKSRSGDPSGMIWGEGFRHWMGYFSGKTMGSLLKKKSG